MTITTAQWETHPSGEHYLSTGGLTLCIFVVSSTHHRWEIRGGSGCIAMGDAAGLPDIDQVKAECVAQARWMADRVLITLNGLR